MATTHLDPRRLARAKDAYVTHRVPREVLTMITVGRRVPRAGDLVLARVERVGHVDAVERPTGHRAPIVAGDEIVVAYGNHHAPDRFETEIPDDLGPCHLVADGGLAARVRPGPGPIDWATELVPIGLLADPDGRPVTLADWALPRTLGPRDRPPTFVVVGGSIDAGTADSATGLLRGLVAAGLQVGAAKVTGTGAGQDRRRLRDGGANPVYDVTDAGLPSTSLASPENVLGVVATLTGHLAVAGVDAIVLEVADGLEQRETAALLASPAFAAGVDGVLFAAADAMVAVAGVARLRQHALPVRAVGGMVTTAPLGIREAADATGLPVLTNAQLQDGEGVAFLGVLPLAA